MSVLDEIKEELPSNAQIVETVYEGPDVILYTENPSFFKDSGETIRRIVSKVKKRVEIRSAESLLKDQEKTKEFIKENVPAEAGIRDIYFEPEFAKVIIHAEKPGVAIGKAGEILRLIKTTTFWTPDIKRAPAIDSEIIAGIRRMMHKEAGYRKKFLNSLGEKIYGEKKEVDWIRVTGLGAFREVGRSAVFVSTPQSRVLLDCGVAFSSGRQFPHLEAPEFDLQKLDAVIISHAHLDHCLPPETPVLMADGTARSIDEISEGDEVMSMNFKTGAWEAGKCAGKTSTTGHRQILKLQTPYRILEASPNHRFFTVRNLDVVESEAQYLAEGEFLPTNLLQISQSGDYDVQLDTVIEYDTRRKGRVNLPSSMTKELAALMGYLQGDGHRSSNFSIRATDMDKTLIERYGNIVRKIFGFGAIIRHHSDKTKNAWWLEINSAQILRFLEKNFPTILSVGNDRSVPEKILRATAGMKAAYLRGFFDAEGSAILKHPAVKVTNYNQKMLSQIWSMLAELGIPASLDKKFHTLKIASAYGINRFAGEIGFNSDAKKAKLAKIARTAPFENDFIPITSRDLQHIIKQAGMFGRVHNSPQFRRFLALYDWFRRNPDSNCTRGLASELIEILDSRLEELSSLQTKIDDNMKFVRQRLSMPISDITHELGLTKMVVEYREDGFNDQICLLMREYLNQRLAQTISLTQSNIAKIKHLLSLPVTWEKIRSIERLENPYDRLIDIEVLPNRNFVAAGTVVHNCGIAPYLYEYGYRGPLFCTRPTRDLSLLLQMDYIKIANSEGKKSPYTSRGIEEMLKHTVTLEYGQVTDITPDFRVTLENSGHLLGASSTHMNIGDGTYNLVYTADMKYERTKLFDPAFTDFARVEGVIIESTYGDERLPSHVDGERKLIDVVREVTGRGGRVLIPTFAVGRAQDVIVMLMDSDLQVPVYLDGMLWDATAIHTAYPEFLSKSMQTEILRKKNNPFIDPRVKGIGSGAERREVLHSSHPCVVLSTSGMLQGGPAMEYLREFAPNPANCMLFVGYQAEGTFGRRIQKGWRYVPMEGNDHGLELKLQIDTVSGLSGHSDAQQLINWIRNLRTKPRKIICQHGESSVAGLLARTLHNELRIDSVAPKNLETVRLK